MYIGFAYLGDTGGALCAATSSLFDTCAKYKQPRGHLSCRDEDSTTDRPGNLFLFSLSLAVGRNRALVGDRAVFHNAPAMAKPSKHRRTQCRHRVHRRRAPPNDADTSSRATRIMKSRTTTSSLPFLLLFVFLSVLRKCLYEKHFKRKARTFYLSLSLSLFFFLCLLISLIQSDRTRRISFFRSFFSIALTFGSSFVIFVGIPSTLSAWRARNAVLVRGRSVRLTVA